MLTAEQFDMLDVGDVIEAVPLFPKLDEEPVRLKTAKRSKSGAKVDFVVTYMGVTLGRWTCAKSNGELKWQFQ